MKWIILIVVCISILLIGCENSTQTCLRYCMDGKDTSGHDLKSAWNELQQAEIECKKQCSETYG